MQANSENNIIKVTLRPKCNLKDNVKSLGLNSVCISYHVYGQQTVRKNNAIMIHQGRHISYN